MPPSRFFQIAWRLALTILLLVIMLVVSIRYGALRAGAQSNGALGSGDPLVLAFYYTWFDDNTWSSGTLSDLPAQRYVSADRAAMGRHIDQAKAAGIDAFVVAWYGPGGGNQTEPNLAALLEEAAARDFRIAILFESDSPFMPGPAEAGAGLQHAAATHATHPAYLRVDGRPVTFFWRTQRYGIDTWRSLRDQADPSRSALWIADGVDTSYLQLFDGHHLYSNTWNPPANLEAINAKFAGQVAGYRNSSGAPRYWVATAMPGYNDVRVRPSNGFVQDREGGAYYDRSWAAALSANPNWVVITSFNEWPEGSHIEPSESYGDQYLGATAQWSARFKQGGGAGPQSAAAPGDGGSVESAGAPQAAQEQPAQEQAAQEQARTAYTAPTLIVETSLLNVRGGPGVDFPLLGTAPAGAALPIAGRLASDVGSAGDAQAPVDAWWQVEVNGALGWVSGDFGRAEGPLDDLPTIAWGAEALPDALAAASDATEAAEAGAAPAGADGATLLQLSQPLVASADGEGGAAPAGLLAQPEATAAPSTPVDALPVPAGGWDFAGPQPVLSPRP